MKKFILVFSFICAINAAYCDILFLNEGEEHTGNLLSIKGDNITFQRLNAEQPEIFKTKDVAHILLSKTRAGDEISKVSDVKDPIAAKILSNLPDSDSFPEADYVTLYRYSEYEFISPTEMNVKSRSIVQILKEPGLTSANKSFYYNPDNTDFQIEYAHTYSPDGRVYHLTDDAISDEALDNTTPEYAKTKKLKIAMKKVDLGSIIDCSTTRKVKNIGPLNPKSILDTFGEREPVMHEEINVTFPSKLKFKKIEQQWENNPPKFTDKSTKDKVVWNWVFSDPKGYIAEQNMLPSHRIFPTIAVFNEYDKSDTAALLTQGYKEAQPSDKTLVEFMKKVEIKEDDTDYEKVCKIYDFLNNEIKIIDMDPDDMGDFRPVSAEITITKKYANAQAFLALMHYMLKKIGIKSYIGFTANKRVKFTYSNYGNLDFATYPVLKVMIDGKAYYTDGGSTYTPFSVIYHSIHGSEANFLDEENKKFFTEQLPNQTLDWNTYNRIIHVKIQENGTMDVDETILYRGPYEESIRELKSLEEKTKSNYAERRAKSVHPNAILKSYGFTDMTDLSSPAVYSISYTIPEAVQKASDNIMTFTNFWVNYGAGSASLSKRKYPMKYWTTECTTKTIIFELPENFNWVKWDKQYKFIAPNISFTSNINQTNRQIVYSDRFEINTDEFLDNKSYQEYRQCMLRMSELANQWIIIEK